MTLWTPDPFTVAADIFDPPVNPYTGDPVRWVRERRQAHVTDQQAAVLSALVEYRRTAVHSAHDLGKSFTAGSIADWWIDIHPIGTAKVVTTAPSGDQVKGIVWQEIQSSHSISGSPGRVLQTEWWIGDFQAGVGRKPSDYNPAAFQGYHAKYLLVLIDEACGVPKPIFDAAESVATGEYNRILAIGNPDDSSSHFAQLCKPGSGWHVIHLDGLESPAFTDEKERTPQAVLDVLLSPVWVEERKKSWGETSPLYIAKVRGLFPADDPDGVVRASMAAKCVRGSEYLPMDSRLAPVEGGLDVAAGGDQSVLVVRHGCRPEVAFEDVSKDSEIVVGKTMLAIKEHGITRLKVDTIGWGWGVAGHLKDKIKEEGLACEVVSVNVAEAASDTKRFPLVRDEIWWDIGRQMCEEEAWDLSLVGDQAVADLLAPKWSPTPRGQIKVEPKDETRKRLGRSPDHGDALLLSFYDGKQGLERYLDALARERTTKQKNLEAHFGKHPLT